MFLPPDTKTPSAYVIKGRHIIHLNSVMNQGGDIIQLKNATFAPSATASSVRRSYAHNIIYSNCANQVLSHDSYKNCLFVNPKINAPSTSLPCIVYLTVCGLLSTKTINGIFAACLKLCFILTMIIYTIKFWTVLRFNWSD